MTLYDIRPGNEVLVVAPLTMNRMLKVQRTTDKQIVLVNGVRYWKHNGKRVGAADTMRASYISVADKADRTMIKINHAKAKLSADIRELMKKDLTQLDVHQLKDIRAVLQSCFDNADRKYAK